MVNGVGSRCYLASRVLENSGRAIVTSDASRASVIVGYRNSRVMADVAVDGCGTAISSVSSVDSLPAGEYELFALAVIDVVVMDADGMCGVRSRTGH